MADDADRLSELPTICLEKTIDQLGLKDRIAVRKSCTRIRNITDTRRFHHHCVGLVIAAGMISIDVHNPEEGYLRVEYIKHPLGCVVKTPEKLKLLMNENFIKIAILDLKTYIASPRVTIGTLVIFKQDLISLTDEDKEMFAQMKTLLESLNHQLSVEAFYFHHRRTEDVMGILQCLQPGVLDQISVPEQTDWLKIMETEQWKQATKVTTGEGNIPRVEAFFHFRNAIFNCEKLTMDQFKKFVEVASQPPYDSQYQMYAGVTIETPAIRQHLQQFPNRSVRIRNSNLHHIPIPNSNCYVQISWHSSYIDMRTVRDVTLASPTADEFKF